MTRHVAFLFFHENYHSYHSAPIAFELSSLSSDIQVHLFTASPTNHKLIEQLGKLYPHHKAIFHLIQPNLAFRYFNIKKRRFPKPRLMLEKASASLNKMDMIVGTSFETSRLFEDYGVSNPKFVFAFHGAGDRAYGFQKSISKYDYLLISGQKIENRLRSLGILKSDNFSVVGYPKFDVTLKLSKQKPRLFANNLPVVLYNPHWDRHLSSWYLWGKTILQYFSNSKDYNLIFAPHSLIKSWKQRWLSLNNYRNCENIHIDLGSKASFDMSYAFAADIYLGDVSSQVYEFLMPPRPCIFLNSHHVEWHGDENYAHWRLGQVIDEPDKLEQVLTNANPMQVEYQPLQEEAMSQTVSNSTTPASKRAADAIRNWIT